MDERIKAEMKQAEDKVKEEFGKVDEAKKERKPEEEPEAVDSSNPPPLHR